MNRSELDGLEDDPGVADRITRLVLQRLEEGVVPWRKPWSTSYQLPRPLGRHRPYGGWNRLILSWAGFLSPCWVTEERAARRGWTPRPGEEPLPIFTLFEVARTHRRQFRTRTHWVFNLQQLEGVPNRSLAIATAEEKPATDAALAERVALLMPRPPRIEVPYHHAAYSPRRDTVFMPPRDSFDSGDDYYSTLFHELVHSTGHEQRLARTAWPKGARWLHEVVRDYAYEELVAETGAAMLCDETGVDPAQLDASAAYIGHWLDVLGKDHQMLFRATREGAAAAEYILGRSSRAWDHTKPDTSEIQASLDLIESRDGIDAMFPGGGVPPAEP